MVDLVLLPVLDKAMAMDVNGGRIIIHFSLRIKVEITIKPALEYPNASPNHPTRKKLF
jgi:hypothetical protein